MMEGKYMLFSVKAAELSIQVARPATRNRVMHGKAIPFAYNAFAIIV